MSFKYIIIYLNAVQIALAVSNYCAINFENVHCENTTMEEFKLLVESYKSKIYNLSFKCSDLRTIREDTFVGYKNLTNLNLDSNNLIDLNINVFSDLSHLESLSLKNNSITNLKQDVFNGLTKVKILHLDYNHINIILPFRTFSKLVGLEVLTLSHNSIRRISSNTFSGNKLLRVDLSYNNIHTIMPYSFSYRESKIESLDLTYNQLTTIQSEAFAHIPNLQNLNISNNRLLDMNFVLALTNIRHLDLSSNTLTSISNNIIKLDKLELLNLSNNFITTIDLMVIKILSKLQEIFLYKNRLSCSWYQENYDKIPQNIYLQNYNLTIIPQSNYQNAIVFECFNEDNVPNMVLLKGSRPQLRNPESRSIYETCENANEFGFFEIYFWLSLGAVGVYTFTTLCANCLRRSEAHQNLRRKNMALQSNEKATLYTFNVTRNGTLHSHMPNKIMINGSGSIDKRGYEHAVAKK